MTDHCPICKTTESTDFYTITKKENHSFKIVTCNSCGHVFTLLPQKIDLASYYEEDDYRVVDIRKSIFFKLMKFEYSRILNVLKQLRTHSKSVLDFGCGKGNFLWFAKEKGWSTQGVETAVARAEYARNVFHLDVSTDYYSAGKIAGKTYDVIVLLHVLEHLPDPRELLCELIKENLNKDGILLIEVPNFNSLQAKLAKDKWIHLDVPRHRSHFTEKTVLKILNSLKLKPVKQEYFSFHLGVLGMVQCMLSASGYSQNILTKLKYDKTIGTIMLILSVLPFAFLLEGIASLFKRGSVVRTYAIVNQ